MREGNINWIYLYIKPKDRWDRSSEHIEPRLARRKPRFRPLGRITPLPETDRQPRSESATSGLDALRLEFLLRHKYERKGQLSGGAEGTRTPDPLNAIQLTPLFHIISPEFRVFHN